MGLLTSLILNRDDLVLPCFPRYVIYTAATVIFIACLVVTSMAQHCHQESGFTKALRVLELLFLSLASLLTTTSPSLLLHALNTLNPFPFQHHSLTMLSPQPRVLCSHLLCLLSFLLLSLDCTFSKKSS